MVHDQSLAVANSLEKRLLVGVCPFGLGRSLGGVFVIKEQGVVPGEVRIGQVFGGRGRDVHETRPPSPEDLLEGLCRGLPIMTVISRDDQELHRGWGGPGPSGRLGTRGRRRRGGQCRDHFRRLDLGDVIKRDRPENRNGHVETDHQVAVGVVTVSIPEESFLGDAAGQLEDHRVMSRAQAGLEHQGKERAVFLVDRETGDVPLGLRAPGPTSRRD